jgi:hypothetical protein
MKQKAIYISLVLVLFCAVSYGQVRLVEPPALSNAMRIFIEQNKGIKEVNAWRVQVLATTDRRQMEEARRQFEKLFPDMQSEWSHEQPYYKIKVGAYLKRREALSVCQEIKKNFRQAITVFERVEYSELIE